MADRLAQMVVKNRLEPELEPLFHADSYCYRTGRSAHHAVRKARQRCFAKAWVLDVDIKGCSDNIDWALLLKAVRKHSRWAWVTLYIRRCLGAAVVIPDGIRLSLI